MENEGQKPSERRRGEEREMKIQLDDEGEV